MRGMSRSLLAAVFFVVCALAGVRTYGQGGATGALEGVVVDSTGSAIEGADVQIIDQRFLPHEFVIEELTTVAQVAAAIREMHVRGAGLIGATAAYGMYLATLEGAGDFLLKVAADLKATRPTAVNLAWAVDRQMQAMARGSSTAEKTDIALATAKQIADEERAKAEAHEAELRANKSSVLRPVSIARRLEPHYASVFSNLDTANPVDLVPPLALRIDAKKIAAVLALMAALFYTALAGAPVPAQRACAMAGFALLAILLDRTALSLRLVAWSAVIVLAVAPESLTGASFQMSFAAVVALIAAWEAAAGWRRRLAASRRGTTRRCRRPPFGFCRTCAPRLETGRSSSLT